MATYHKSTALIFLIKHYCYLICKIKRTHFRVLLDLELNLLSHGYYAASASMTLTAYVLYTDSNSFAIV